MSAPIRKAMVLAAGHGQRLRPLTAHMAKPAVPMLGRPMIEYILRRLGRDGVTDAVVNLHHEMDSVAPSLERPPDGLTVHRSVEEELLGTAGGLKHAACHFSTENVFLLMNADTLVDFDLDALLTLHEESGAAATLLLRPKPPGSSYSSVETVDDGRIQSITTGRPDGDWMFAGVWLLAPRVLDMLSGSPAGLEKELLPRLIAEESAYGCRQPATWITIDTPRRYWGACLTMIRERLFEADWNVSELTSRTRATVLVGEETTLSRTAVCRGEVVLGAGCRVDKGAHLENVIVWDSVVVPAGVRLVDCVVTSEVSLEPGMELEQKLIMSARGDTSGLRKREITRGLLVADLSPERSAGL